MNGKVTSEVIGGLPSTALRRCSCRNSGGTGSGRGRGGGRGRSIRDENRVRQAPEKKLPLHVLNDFVVFVAPSQIPERNGLLQQLQQAVGAALGQCRGIASRRSDLHRLKVAPRHHFNDRNP